jgi:hypothetical protein
MGGRHRYSIHPPTTRSSGGFSRAKTEDLFSDREKVGSSLHEQASRSLAEAQAGHRTGRRLGQVVFKCLLYGAAVCHASAAAMAATIRAATRLGPALFFPEPPDQGGY